MELCGGGGGGGGGAAGGGGGGGGGKGIDYDMTGTRQQNTSRKHSKRFIGSTSY